MHYNSPKSFLISTNSQKQVINARHSLENMILHKRVIKNPLNVNSTFPLHPVPFYGNGYEKQKGLGTS